MRNIKRFVKHLPRVFRWSSLTICAQTGVVRTWNWGNVSTEAGDAEKLTAQYLVSVTPGTGEGPLILFPKFLNQRQRLELNTTHCVRAVDGQFAYQLPFRFVTPRRLISLGSDVQDQFLNLPPSMMAGPEFQNPLDRCTYAQPSIVYAIDAVLESRSVSSAMIATSRDVREIRIMPFTTASPPLDLGHFPNDYRTTSVRQVKQHLWSKALGEMTVSMVEPSPLNVCTSASRAVTEVALKIEFKPLDAVKMSICPHRWNCLVDLRLHVKTFYSTRLLEQTPCIDMLRRRSQFWLRSKYIKLPSFKLDTLPWRLNRLSPHGTILQNQSPSWVATITLPISAPNTLLPTFLTILTARTFALQVNFKIVDVYHGPLELEVPLQVVFKTPRGVISDPSETTQIQVIPPNLSLSHIKFTIGYNNTTTGI